MALDRITLSDFRNHAATQLDDTRAFNLLYGENGAGKTNVLEALSLFAPGRGLRRGALTDMARGGGPGGFAVSAALDCGDGGDRVMIGTGVQADRPGRRLVQVNGTENPAIALGEWLAVGWLTPAMDRLFMDSAGGRRRYMDRLTLALDPAHARNASRYEAALRERNRLLSADVEPESQWMDAIEAQMADAGAALASGRVMLVEQLSQALHDLPPEPFARPELRYVPGGPVGRDALQEELRAMRRRDRAARRSLSGPHRDELEVTMAGKGVAAAQCSTGEQKAMLIAMTLAHAELSKQGRPGLLLLDEVAAHLDPVRRAALFARLRTGSAQVWMTGTERAPFEAIAEEAAVWRVNGGGVERVS
ncbi:MAG: DNA replication/repair protein RecF [Novosphingobium sp.]|nr:DNA replication/repair protein RecF [Novosphingobium sp.]